jgi:hypothetical protein
MRLNLRCNRRCGVRARRWPQLNSPQLDGPQLAGLSLMAMIQPLPGRREPGAGP